MEILKQESIEAISKLPYNADIDDSMYRLYVIDKTKRGEKAVEEGQTISTNDLREEMESW